MTSVGRSCGKEQQRQEMLEMEAEGQDKLQTELLCYQRGKTLKQRAVEAAVEICAHTNEDFAAKRLTAWLHHRDAVSPKLLGATQSFLGSYLLIHPHREDRIARILALKPDCLSF